VIALSLRSNSVLTWLDLDCNNEHIGPRGALALGEMLFVNAALKTLFLDSCAVGDEGAGHLAVALRRNRALETLVLSGNGITHVGASTLAASLPFNQTLKWVKLGKNPLDDDGVVALAKAVPLSGLRGVVLRDTKLGHLGCAALVEMLKSGSRLQEF
jgi:NLR family CARD domain-containing protein 3